MNKKAEGLSMNVIIIAIIALIVLIVLVLIFTGTLKRILPDFQQDNCVKRGGQCTTLKGTCTGSRYLGLGCPDDQTKKDNIYCCINE
jgi:hypothetical protein